MLFTLVIYRAYGTRALPVSSPPSTNELLFVAESSCQTLGQCRTIWDIIWSCLATIFSCTWVAIHPNISSPEDGWLVRSSRRIGITLMALIAPEIVILWAMRQWLAARELRDLHREHNWTMTHAFFAIMGGFMLHDERGPKQVLLPDELKELADDGTIDFPSISQGEIQDKSKGDFLSKGLVILQTTWFLVQCGARGIGELPLTQLEIVTLAYAVVNFVTYAIWWNKLLNIQCAYPVQKKTTAPDGEKREEDIPGVVQDSDERAEPTAQEGRAQSSVRRRRRCLPCPGGLGILIDLIMLPITPFFNMATGSLVDHWRYPLRVPTFFSGSKSSSLLAALLAAAVATGFGAIHCIAWSFKLPSPRELLLWRISSVAITSIPLSLLFAIFMAGFRNAGVEWFRYAIKARLNRGGRVRVLRIVINALKLTLTAWVVMCYVVEWLCLGAELLYIAARLGVLVQAFISLRASPEGVLKTVWWTTFIPHL